MTDSYENEVKRYKKKYTNARCVLNSYHIKKGLEVSGYCISDLPDLLSSNSDKLKTTVEKIARQHPDGVGNISSVLYSGIICELLDLCEIEYVIHVGFVLPTKVNDLSKYNCPIVNYMYVVSENGVKYHYFNGVINDSTFTYIRDDIVEV